MIAKISLTAFLLLSLQAFATPASPAARTEFRNVMDEIALNSVTQPLICHDSEGQDFRFTLQIEKDPDYLEAFNVAFVQDGEIIRTTLIAYLGEAGYPLGTLQIVREAGSVVYQHVFDGYLDDVVRVEAGSEGLRSFRYSQDFEGKRVYDLSCLIGPKLKL